MSENQKISVPNSPTTREVMEYLKDQVLQGLKFQAGDKSFISVNIGLGCPRYPVDISLHSLELDRCAGIILNDLGIPDAIDTSGSNRNFDDVDYLSISGKSLKAFRDANKEKILEWVARQAASQKEPEI
jgi:hypothetical protein